jgi:TolB-like protein/AraC-like DNA-binding protein
MNLYLAEDIEFIENLSKIILDNLSNENFGISELIKVSGVNKNYLRSRIKSIKKITVNQFITEIRLEKALEFLLEGTYTAAEVSYNVGFNSPSYFNRCFHNHFGYPPGDIKKRTVSKSESGVSEDRIDKISNPKMDSNNVLSSRNVKFIYIVAALFVVAGIIFISIFFIRNSLGFEQRSKEKSIAVLPFKNLSENEENRYFADGVVEDILDRLTKIKELKVVSRTSVEQFRESIESTPEIAKKLGVNYLLEGSVQRQEGKVRITIQLIDAKNDRHILSEKIDRALEDILVLESDIAKLVADKLQAAISPSETELIDKEYTSNTQAYDYYLMGRYYWNLLGFESLKKSLEYFERAIKADSTYALAYAGMAEAYYALSDYRIKPIEGIDKSCELAKKALQIDPKLPEAYALLGMLYSDGYWQWEKARTYFEKAMEIDSSNMVTLYYYSAFLNTLGEFDASRRYINRALEFAPYSIKFRRSSSYFYHGENKQKEALQEILKVQEMLGDKFDQQHYVFWCYVNAGDTMTALKFMQKAFETVPKYKKYKAYANQIFPVYKASGLTGLYSVMYKNSPSYWYAVQLDSIDVAIRYLQKYYENREPTMYYLILDPDFVKLHKDPRFLEIVDKTHLTPYFNKRYKK